MKASVIRLTETDILTGRARQTEVKTLSEYMNDIQPALVTLASTEIKELYEYIEKHYTDVMKRSDSQLLSSDPGKPKSASPSVVRPSTIALKLPSFHGDLLKWKDFWTLFTSRLDKEPGLTDADKSCLLVEAMADTKARQRAEAAIAHTTTYNDAVTALKKYYEDNRLLFGHHYDELHQVDNFKDTVEDLDRLETRINASVRGIEASNGYSVSQYTVAALERMMSPGLSRQWKQYTHELQDPPPIGQLLAFIER